MFIFFSLITFQVTILSIVAIVFGQNKIAEKAMGSLTSVLERSTSKSEKPINTVASVAQNDSQASS